MLSIKKILELSEVRDPVCLSMYLDTHERGIEVLNKQDQLNLKGRIQQIERDLNKHFSSAMEVEAFVAPLKELMDDGTFWRKQNDGLAIFLSQSGLHKFALPVALDEKDYLATHFMLWPLLPLFSDDGDYYLLTLNLQDVHLYRGTRFSFSEILQEKLSKVTMEEIVGTDYEQRNLQFRTQQMAQGGATFHGQGEGKDDVKGEIFNYFKAIDAVVKKELADKTIPLLVGGLDHLVGIYREANNYGHLVEEYLEGNPKDYTMKELHMKSWNILQERFQQHKEERAGLIEQFLGTARASNQITEILPAVFEGRVDTMFIRAGKEIWGIYDPVSHRIRLDEGHHSSNVSLINLAAMQTIAHGGHVFVTRDRYLPTEGTDICALYRY